MGSSKEVHILLVEDNEGDIVLTKEAFDHGSFPNRISVARDGEEALDFLFRRKAFSDEEKPDLILMDINIPKINGLEVLDIVKNDESLKSIPVIVLTTSSDLMDVKSAYSKHVNCYIIKPIDYAKFSQAVSDIENFWFTLVTIPITQT